MKKLTLVALVGFLLIGVSLDQAYAAKKKFLSLGTGNPSGTFYFVGAGFASIWNKYIKEIRVVAESTAASVENTNLVARGKMDIGMASAGPIAKIKAKGKIDLSNVRLMCSSFHGSHYHWLVRKESRIKTYKDLKGKRLAMGQPGSGTLVSSTEMVRAWGWDPEKDIDRKYMSFSEAINALRDGTIDCGLVAAAFPVAAILDLTFTVPIRIIDVPTSSFVKPNQTTNLYTEMVIPAGTYKGIDRDVITQATPTFILVNKNLDTNIVYKLLKHLYEHPKKKDVIHPVAKEYNLKHITFCQ